MTYVICNIVRVAYIPFDNYKILDSNHNLLSPRNWKHHPIFFPASSLFFEIREKDSFIIDFDNFSM